MIGWKILLFDLTLCFFYFILCPDNLFILESNEEMKIHSLVVIFCFVVMCMTSLFASSHAMLSDINAIIDSRLSYNEHLIEVLADPTKTENKRLQNYLDIMMGDSSTSVLIRSLYLDEHLETVRSDQNVYLVSKQLCEQIDTAETASKKQEAIDLLYAYLSTHIFIDDQKGDYRHINPEFFEHDYIDYIDYILAQLKPYCSDQSLQFHSYFVFNLQKNKVSVDYEQRSELKKIFKENIEKIISECLRFDNDITNNFIIDLERIAKESQILQSQFVQKVQTFGNCFDVITLKGFCYFYTFLAPELFQLENFYSHTNCHLSNLCDKYNEAIDVYNKKSGVSLDLYFSAKSHPRIEMRVAVKSAAVAQDDQKGSVEKKKKSKKKKRKHL